jgi:ribosomal-protein-alanine N-acetyltransferase
VVSIVTGVVRRTVVETARLRVTTWAPSDVSDLHQLHSDPAVMRFLRNGEPEEYETSQRRLEQYVTEQASQGWTKWRVEDLAGVMVGRAGFGGYGQHCELGYTLRADVWGRGLGTELAVALTRWHIDHHPTHQLWAYAVRDNQASRRVLEKVGFHLTGFRERHGREHAFYMLSCR